MSDSGDYIGSDRDSFHGLTPQQYHAQLDQLWCVLPREHKGPPYSGTVFDRAEAYITALRAENAELRRVMGQCEWGCPCGEKGGACPLCDAAFLRAGVGTKHKPDCPLGRALGRPGCGEGTT